jgi:hypothetical protein
MKSKSTLYFATVMRVLIFLKTRHTMATPTQIIVGFLIVFPLAFSAAFSQTVKSQPAGASDSVALGKQAAPAAVKIDTSTTLPVNQPAAMQPSATKATSGADSLKKAQKRDSLANETARLKARPMQFPTALDSVFSASVIGPWQLFHSDAASLSEAARALPQVVYVPYALTSGLNRFMLYGFPLLPNGTSIDNSAFFDSPTPVSGNDGLFCTQLDAVYAAPPNGLACAQLPYGLVVPHADVLWENGAFNENILGVRFARPLTKTTDIGVFSNYRYSAPFTYSTANDMQSLFGYFYSDTSLLANNGRNPLSNESQMELRLGSHSERWGTASLSYSYQDSKNDMATQYVDTTINRASLQWKKITAFSNTLRAQVRSLPVGRLAVNADAEAVLEGHTADYPLVNNSVPLGEKAPNARLKGQNTELAVMVEPYLALRADTFLVSCAGQRVERGLYDQTKAAATIGDVRLRYRRGFSFPALIASVKASCGDAAAAPAGGPAGHSFVYNAELSAHAGMQSLRLFAGRDHMPFVLPYDTLDAPVASYFDIYDAYGADVFLGYKKIGLTAGICAVSGADTAGALRWPDASMPYRRPRVSLMVAPLLGRWLGFAICSRYMLSDTRPYLKSQSTLSYEAHPLGGKEHITVDLVYDYWSSRDPLSYGGIDLWSRELNSLSLRMAVHIQGFNLFYKVDNVLNRRFAYVPGYFMPGITFRWGFQWLIQ